MNTEHQAEIEALRQELRREHADHAQTVDDASILARENTELRKENEGLRAALSYAVAEADGWHDDCRGGRIMDDPKMEAARALLQPDAAMKPAAQPVQPAYAVGQVVGPCVCGSWPAGECLKCTWIPAQPVQPAKPALEKTTLEALARQCLWIAYCWNEHNFDDAFTYARKTAQQHGIKDFDEANEWLAAQPVQPAGWKLVPIEPTPEMLTAADDGDRAYTLRNFGNIMTVLQGAEDHWAAMIFASPNTAQPVQPADEALRKDAERYEFVKTLEGQVVTMETFKTYGSAALDQALDDAMSIVATIDAAMKPAQQEE